MLQSKFKVLFYLLFNQWLWYARYYMHFHWSQSVILLFTNETLIISCQSCSCFGFIWVFFFLGLPLLTVFVQRHSVDFKTPPFYLCHACELNIPVSSTSIHLTSTMHYRNVFVSISFNKLFRMACLIVARQIIHGTIIHPLWVKKLTIGYLNYLTKTLFLIGILQTRPCFSWTPGFHPGCTRRRTESGKAEDGPTSKK